MADLDALIQYCDRLLDVGGFEDYAPNGLQVEAGREVHHLVSGVSAGRELIEAAAGLGADTLLVHHGYFWRGEPAPLTGVKGRRIRALYRHGISLVAYHLPLDAHPQYGNNARLGTLLGIREAAPVPGSLLWQGALDAEVRSGDFAGRVGERLGRTPLHVGDAGAPLRRIAWCSGAAQDLIEEAAALGVDAFLTGEVSERTVLFARELGLHFFAAGHHATERLGVAALGEHLAERFGLRHDFIDIPNPA